MMTLPGPPAVQWDALAERASNLFATRSWCETWWEHYGRGGSPLLVQGGHGDAGYLVPLYVSGGLLRRVRLIGHGPADQLGPVCGPQGRAGAAAAVRAALRDPGLGWDVLLAHDVAEPEQWDQWLGATVIRRTASPAITLGTTDWDAFLGGRSKNFREQVRRRERKLRKAFHVELRLATADTLAADLGHLFRLHRARWGDDAPFATGAEQRFHEDFAPQALADGRLRLWVLELDGRPAAALHGFRFAGVEYFHQSGRDPELEEHSVGSVLLTHSIREALQDGMREYRLLRGDEAYKSRFADVQHGVHTLAVPRGLRGQAGLVALVAAQQPVLAHAVLQRLPDRVREQHRPDRVLLPLRVAPALVEVLDVREAEAVQRRRRPAVQLEHPEP